MPHISPVRNWEQVSDTLLWRRQSAEESSLDPLGYIEPKQLFASTSTQDNVSKQKNNAELKSKKAWEVAKTPSKSIFMTAFMLWMSGSGINIFSIMITMYSVMNPVKDIFNVNNVFSKFEDASVNLLLPKLLYIFINCISLTIALYKCWVLGLLPTTIADWVYQVATKYPEEFSFPIVQNF